VLTALLIVPATWMALQVGRWVKTAP
jgi:hypothetical protein